MFEWHLVIDRSPEGNSSHKITQRSDVSCELSKSFAVDMHRLVITCMWYLQNTKTHSQRWSLVYVSWCSENISPLWNNWDNLRCVQLSSFWKNCKRRSTRAPCVYKPVADHNALINGPRTRYVTCRLHMRRECWERFARHRLQRKPVVSDPGMHHGTCVTHVPWCRSGSLTRGSGENVPGIPGAWVTRKFTYLARGPCHQQKV